MVETLIRVAYSPAETARLLGIARSTVYAWIERGEIRCVRMGGRTFIAAAEINRVLAQEQASNA